tara:strand:- start:2409 stop:2591 length:183 start_codon:yes stop_codon:yes gene_type:complete
VDFKKYFRSASRVPQKHPFFVGGGKTPRVFATSFWMTFFEEDKKEEAKKGKQTRPPQRHI